jgi:hypothetical protein
MARVYEFRSLSFPFMEYRENGEMKQIKNGGEMKRLKVRTPSS